MSESEILTISAEETPEGATVLALRGELDLSSIGRVEQKLVEAAKGGDPILVDLTELSFVDSSGIAGLIRAHHAGRVLMVVAKGSQVDRVLELAGIDRELSVFNSRAEALAAVK